MQSIKSNTLCQKTYSTNIQKPNNEWLRPHYSKYEPHLHLNIKIIIFEKIDN